MDQFPTQAMSLLAALHAVLAASGVTGIDRAVPLTDSEIQSPEELATLMQTSFGTLA
jgi:hypothetical protein